MEWGEFKLWGSQTSHRNRSFNSSVEISIIKHQVKGKNHTQKVGLKYSREIPDTTAMHIAETFPLNKPLLYADSESYFAMTILLYILALLSACTYFIVIRRQWKYIRGRIWYWGILLLRYFPELNQKY